MIQEAVNQALGIGAKVAVGATSLKAATDLIQQKPGFKNKATIAAKQQLGFTGNKSTGYGATAPDDIMMRQRAVERLSSRIAAQKAREEAFKQIQHGLLTKIIKEDK